MVPEGQLERGPLARALASGAWAYNFDNVYTRLVNAAWAALLSRSASSLTLREVAGAVGITVPALYKHFADRDALIDQLAAAAFRKLAIEVRAASTRAEPGLRVRAALGAYFTFARKRPFLLELAFSPRYRDRGRFSMFAQDRAAFRVHLGEALAQDLERLPQTREIEQLWSLLHGAAVLGALDEPVDPDLLEGILPPRTGAH